MIPKAPMRFTIAVILSMASHGIVRAAATNGFVKDSANLYVFNNKFSRLLIDKNTWQMDLFGADGKKHYSSPRPPAFFVRDKWMDVSGNSKLELTGEKEALITVGERDGFQWQIAVHSVSDNGFNIKMKSSRAAVLKIRDLITLNPVEEIYGFGEMWNGRVAQRGQSLQTWDQAGTPDECAYMPYFVSTNNYAFFLNYGGPVNFDIGKRNANELVFEAPVAELDMTLVSGSSIAATVRHFLQVTGMPARPPSWSFKPWYWLMGNPFHPGNPNAAPPFSNYSKPPDGLNSLKDVHFLQMVKKLQGLDLPIGVTWLEPMWQDARTSFIPNKAFTPDLKKLIGDLRDLGVYTLAWTVPYTTKDARQWDEAVSHHYLVEKPGKAPGDQAVKISATGELVGQYYNYIDFYDSTACEWWQKQIEQALELGLKGFKLDAGQDLPADAILHGGRIGKDVHNAYALRYNQVFYNALHKKYGEDFLMIPRAAWVGSSSYTNFKWPGDLTGSFANNGLPSSVYSTLSLSFCGIPFVSTDIGGFTNQPAPEDVWIRWAQFGAMLPGMQTLHMPWWYSDKALEHYRFLSWLHTDLAPLWNTLAYEAHETGAPVVRPLVWSYQQDVDTWRVDDQFTLGSSLLLAPVIDTRESREVYLPEGNWIDFWDNSKVIEGPVKINWASPREGLYKFPFYIKEGAIIPMEISTPYSGFGWAGSKGYVTMAIWPKKKGESHFTLHDTGSKVLFEVEQQEKATLLRWGKTPDNYLFRIHYTRATLPAKVEFVESKSSASVQPFENMDAFRAGRQDGWCLDVANQKLWIRINGKSNGGYLKVTN